jgi:hypothetical protein
MGDVEKGWTNSGNKVGTEIFEFKENEFRGDTSAYLGINIGYIPYLLQSTTTIAPSTTTQFSIIISSNN